MLTRIYRNNITATIFAWFVSKVGGKFHRINAGTNHAIDRAVNSGRITVAEKSFLLSLRAIVLSPKSLAFINFENGEIISFGYIEPTTGVPLSLIVPQRTWEQSGVVIKTILTRYANNEGVTIPPRHLETTEGVKIIFQIALD